jgi:hypothetical protein
MPGLDELPEGPRRVFVGSLHGLYRAAGRPTLAKIAETANVEEEREGTASRETVRRLLHGESLGTWQTAQTVIEALCRLAGYKTSDRVWETGGSRTITRIDDFKSRWNAAVDDDEDDAVTPPKEAVQADQLFMPGSWSSPYSGPPLGNWTSPGQYGGWGGPPPGQPAQDRQTQGHSPRNIEGVTQTTLLGRVPWITRSG